MGYVSPLEGIGCIYVNISRGGSGINEGQGREVGPSPGETPKVRRIWQRLREAGYGGWTPWVPAGYPGPGKVAASLGSDFLFFFGRWLCIHDFWGLGYGWLLSGGELLVSNKCVWISTNQCLLPRVGGVYIHRSMKIWFEKGSTSPHPILNPWSITGSDSNFYFGNCSKHGVVGTFD